MATFRRVTQRRSTPTTRLRHRTPIVAHETCSSARATPATRRRATVSARFTIRGAGYSRIMSLRSRCTVARAPRMAARDATRTGAAPRARYREGRGRSGTRRCAWHVPAGGLAGEGLAALSSAVTESSDALVDISVGWSSRRPRRNSVRASRRARRWSACRSARASVARPTAASARTLRRSRASRTRTRRSRSSDSCRRGAPWE